MRDWAAARHSPQWQQGPRSAQPIPSNHTIFGTFCITPNWASAASEAQRRASGHGSCCTFHRSTPQQGHPSAQSHTKPVTAWAIANRPCPFTRGKIRGFCNLPQVFSRTCKFPSFWDSTNKDLVRNQSQAQQYIVEAEAWAHAQPSGAWYSFSNRKTHWNLPRKQTARCHGPTQQESLAARSSFSCVVQTCYSNTALMRTPLLPLQSSRRLMFRSSPPARKEKKKHSQEQMDKEKEEQLYYFTWQHSLNHSM